MDAVSYNLVLANYGWRKAYPLNGLTIRFFRPRKANTTGIAAITENTTGTTRTVVAVGYKDILLAQRGSVAEISDVVQATDLLDTLKLYTKTMGADAALDMDTVIRDALIAGLKDSNTTWGALHNFERYPVGGLATVTADSSDDFDTFKAATQANCKITRAAHLGMVTQLKSQQVPTIGGKYVAITCPQVIHDIRQDTTWVSAATNVDTQALYKRATIALDGAVFVESDNPYIEDETYATYDAADSSNVGLIYSNIYLGEGAFGCPELSNKRAGGSQMGPRMQILANADKSDPNNLKTVIAWKAMWGAAPLITNETGTVPHYGILRTKSTFS